MSRFSTTFLGVACAVFAFLAGTVPREARADIIFNPPDPKVTASGTLSDTNQHPLKLNPDGSFNGNFLNNIQTIHEEGETITDFHFIITVSPDVTSIPAGTILDGSPFFGVPGRKVVQENLDSLIYVNFNMIQGYPGIAPGQSFNIKIDSHGFKGISKVVIAASVPEPSTFLLMAVGITTAMVASEFRQRKSHRSHGPVVRLDERAREGGSRVA